MISQALLDEAAALLDACRAKGVRLATAESATGGLITAVLTAIAGASDVVDRGFVTYSNQAKVEMLGVPAELIAAAGAVSETVAQRMPRARCNARTLIWQCRSRASRVPAAAAPASRWGSCASASRSAVGRLRASITCFLATGPQSEQRRSGAHSR